MGTTRRVFTRDFKAAAVRRLELGASANEVAQDLQVNPNDVYRWRREARHFGQHAFGGYGHNRSGVAPRTRSVAFRLTDAEFEGLEKASAKGPARSLSDFVRAQVLAGRGQPSLVQIDAKLDQLARAAQRIISAICKLEGS